MAHNNNATTDTKFAKMMIHFSIEQTLQNHKAHISSSPLALIKTYFTYCLDTAGFKVFLFLSCNTPKHIWQVALT